MPSRAIARPAIRELGELIPTIRPVCAVLRDGDRVVLSGYVNDRSCTGYIMARFSKARRAYWQACTVETEVERDGQVATESKWQHDEEAWAEFLTSALMAVLVGLELGEAESLSGDEENALGILSDLGWWDQPSQEDETDPPAISATSATSGDSSPTSTPPTDSPTG